MTRILAQVARFPDLSFAPRARDGEPGDAQITGLAAAIESATLRHWLTSETLARSLCTRPWLEVQPEARAAMLVGITQLFFMPREPDHAIVDDAVSWTRGRLQQGAGGFVNAVLRKAIALRGERLPVEQSRAWWDHRNMLPCPDGSAVTLTQDVLPPELASRIAVQTSHPQMLVARWASARGINEARRLAAHSLVEMPLTVHDGSPSGGTKDALGALSAPTAHGTPHSVAGFTVWTGSTSELATALASHPSWIVQDPASARAVEATRGMKPKRILDACAGRGTKAVQLALAHPDAEVWATDPDATRAASLKQRAKALPNLKAVELAELGQLPGHFDLLLLDVPCSNTGVFARRLEARYRFSERSLAEVTQLQRGIAEHHRSLVAKGGSILWSTCSVEPAENSQQAKWLAKMVKGAVTNEDEWLPRGLPGDPDSACTDGSYHARISIG